LKKSSKKPLMIGLRPLRVGSIQRRKSFLLLFFKKAALSSLLSIAAILAVRATPLALRVYSQ
jgi:hypothetical protein